MKAAVCILLSIFLGNSQASAQPVKIGANALLPLEDTVRVVDTLAVIDRMQADGKARPCSEQDLSALLHPVEEAKKLRVNQSDLLKIYYFLEANEKSSKLVSDTERCHLLVLESSVASKISKTFNLLQDGKKTWGKNSWDKMQAAVAQYPNCQEAALVRAETVYNFEYHQWGAKGRILDVIGLNEGSFKIEFNAANAAFKQNVVSKINTLSDVFPGYFKRRAIDLQNFLLVEGK